MKRMPPPRAPEPGDQTTRVSPARRSPKAKAPRATAALEDTTARPSRKSTRRSANRVMAGQEQALAAKLDTVKPSVRTQKRGH